jgi:hypothetical protein
MCELALNMSSALSEGNFNEIGTSFRVFLENPQVPCIGGQNFKNVSTNCHKSMYNKGRKLTWQLFHNLLGQY